MRRSRAVLAAVVAVALFSPAVRAQRHSGLSSPPTAPPAGPSRGNISRAFQPMLAASFGLGAIEFYPVPYATAAPQSLTRQLTAREERIRQSALFALGAPSLYTQHGSVAFPHSIVLELAPLSSSGDLDALLTVELDRHIVTAVLVPDNGQWKRAATVIFPTPFGDTSTTPSSFVRIVRSLTDSSRYGAIFRARVNGPSGNFSESEAHLQILNSRPVITASFVSNSRTCDLRPGTDTPSHCQITHRWFQPDTPNPASHNFLLITGTGTLTSRDLANPLASTTAFQSAHLRTFSCQPFVFSAAAAHYEPTGPAAACRRPPAYRGE